jgi:hypothetical protein
MHVQRYRSHLVLALSTTNGRTAGQTTSTDPRSQRNRASRRGGHQKPGSNSPIVQNGVPNLRAPRSPSSRSAEPKPAAGHHQGLQKSSFMPRKGQDPLSLGS